jgi:AcrR family transcriptional regulator
MQDDIKDPIRGNPTGRTAMYAEIGRYFNPSGKFNEIPFRKALRESYEALKEQYGAAADFSRQAGDWLISYLTGVINYLEEKGLAHSAFALFRAAVNEITESGLSDLVIPSSRLQSILAKVSSITESRDEARRAPDETKKKIFNAALSVFSEKGYHNATIDEIAALSGIGKGSVYRYFASKKELLNELLIEKYEAMIEPLSRMLSSDEDVLIQIRRMIEIWIEFIEKNPVVYRLVQSEAISHQAGEASMFYDYIITRLPLFKERIIALNMEKKLKTTNFYTVFYGILGFIDGVVHKWFRQGMDYPLSEEIPLILEVLFNGFVGETKSGMRFFLPPEE